MAAVKLSIHNPYTIDDIHEAKNETNKKLKKRGVIYFLLFVGILACLGSCIFISTIYSGPKSIAYCTVFIVLSLIFLALGLNAEPDLIKVEEVPTAQCRQLMDACMATPEGIAYRDAVIFQGRKFIEEEALLITNWAKEQNNRLACKELYDIPANNS